MMFVHVNMHGSGGSRGWERAPPRKGAPGLITTLLFLHTLFIAEAWDAV